MQECLGLASLKIVKLTESPQDVLLSIFNSLIESVLLQAVLVSWNSVGTREHQAFTFCSLTHAKLRPRPFCGLCEVKRSPFRRPICLIDPHLVTRCSNSLSLSPTNSAVLMSRPLLVSLFMTFRLMVMICRCIVEYSSIRGDLQEGTKTHFFSSGRRSCIHVGTKWDRSVEESESQHLTLKQNLVSYAKASCKTKPIDINYNQFE